MQLQLLSPSAISPYDRNPRQNDAGVGKVAASIREFGFNQPIAVDEDLVILAGHTRWKAALQLELEHVPVVVVSGLSAAQRRAYRLADNRTAQESDWDDALLLDELLALDAAGFDLALTGFDADELARIVPVDPFPGDDPDAVPEPPAVPVTQPGDAIELGGHRLVCGDSTDPDAWDQLLAGDLVDLVWTDPPYGVSYEAKHQRLAADCGGRRRSADASAIANDDLSPDALQEFLRRALGLAAARSRPGAAWYVAAPAGPLHAVFGGVLTELGIWRQTITWVKDSLVLSMSDYHYRHEPIFYGWKPGAAHYFVDDRTQDTIWEIPRPRRSEEHPTMKPAELVARAVRNSSLRDQLVADPFGGSGTTLMACEMEGRRARLVELAPVYCDVIVARWERFTGKTATRHG